MKKFTLKSIQAINPPGASGVRIWSLENVRSETTGSINANDETLIEFNKARIQALSKNSVQMNNCYGPIKVTCLYVHYLTNRAPQSDVCDRWLWLVMMHGLNRSSLVISVISQVIVMLILADEF